MDDDRRVSLSRDKVFYNTVNQTIIYTTIDRSNNSSTFTIHYISVDTRNPIITVSDGWTGGDTTTLILPTAICTDEVFVTIIGNVFDATLYATYTYTHTAIDGSRNTTVVERKYIVRDTTSPIITVLFKGVQITDYSTVNNEYGVDNEPIITPTDDSLTSVSLTHDTVFYNTVDQTIVYTDIDRSNNSSIFTINYMTVDMIAPTFVSYSDGSIDTINVPINTVYTIYKMEAIPRGLVSRESMKSTAGVKSIRTYILPSNSSGNYMFSATSNKQIVLQFPSFPNSFVNTQRSFLRFTLTTSHGKCMVLPGAPVIRRMLIRGSRDQVLEDVDQYSTLCRIMDNKRSTRRVFENTDNEDFLKIYEGLPVVSNKSTQDSVLFGNIAKNNEDFIVENVTEGIIEMVSQTKNIFTGIIHLKKFRVHLEDFDNLFWARLCDHGHAFNRINIR
jgi:hypothetical protein